MLCNLVPSVLRDQPRSLLENLWQLRRDHRNYFHLYLVVFRPLRTICGFLICYLPGLNIFFNALYCPCCSLWRSTAGDPIFCKFAQFILIFRSACCNDLFYTSLRVGKLLILFPVIATLVRIAAACSPCLFIVWDLSSCFATGACG